MKPKAKKKIFIVAVIAIIVYFLTRKQSTATTTTTMTSANRNSNSAPTATVVPDVPRPADTPNGLNAPNWNIGLSSMFGYGSSWQNEYNKIQGGSSAFWFYGKSNGQSYPTGKNGNGYETVHWSSHSITSTQGYAGVISKCRYTLRDASNNIVLYVDDTKGGYHAFYGIDLRNNNHPDDTLRYLPTGSYNLEYSNTSDAAAPQNLVFYQQHENNSFDYQINEVVQRGETINRTITINNTGSELNTFYKFNNNL